jgi:uncharacterized RDD family membrane protein YckC
MSILGLSIIDTKPVIQGAGFWIRALARVVDTVSGYLMGFFAGMFGGLALYILEQFSLVESGWLTRISEEKWVLFLASLVGGICYQTLCEGICGASLGKLICGLRVLSEDCSPCGLKQAFIRSLAYYFDGLVFGVVGYFEMTKTLMEQRHGDHWAKTLVVRTSQVPEASKPSGGRFFLAITLGSAMWIFFLAVAYVALGFVD